jgi:transcriptional regulator with XRE-family HTH domain
MAVTTHQIRAARSLLGWSQDELATKARVGRTTIAGFEIGKLRMAGSRAFEDVLEVFENAGIEFLDPVEGVSGEGVRFKWGVTPLARQPGEGTAAEVLDGSGMKAAWDFEGEEGTDADIEALLSEQPEPNPDMAEMWRADPELWARLSEGGRETLSQSMFGDRRAAGEGYFRGQAVL